MALFNTLQQPDASKTQLAYKLKYYPFSQLSAVARTLLAQRRIIGMSKAQLIDHLDDSGMFYHAETKHSYAVVWAYNNTPTEQEWNKILPDAGIVVELRVSPSIDGKRVAILHPTGNSFDDSGFGL